jgi:nitrile hydratase subunit beta
VNGIHDMGGMHGMGPIVRDPDERPFHEPWEGRAWGLIRAMGAFRGPGRRKNFRYEHEILSPVDYLRMKYYERFIHIMVMHLLEDRVITQTELDSGKPDPGTTRTTPRLTPAMVVEQMARRGGSLRRDNVRVGAKYRTGDRVRARNINPVGHTRLPRYLRGHEGTIVTDHGVFNLQDTDADGYALGERPQHVYTVRFTARDLWGDQANRRDSVYADLWEDHLERE